MVHASQNITFRLYFTFIFFVFVVIADIAPPPPPSEIVIKSFKLQADINEEARYTEEREDLPVHEKSHDLRHVNRLVLKIWIENPCICEHTSTKIC